jgi:uncharacterized repeat protein (TIGR03803 family)
VTALNTWEKLSGIVLIYVASAISSPAQAFNSLVSFDQQNGAYPLYVALVQGEDGNFYGTTSQGGSTNCDGGCGTVFRVSPAGTLTTLYSFCAEAPPCPDGSGPRHGLLFGLDGDFYGTTTTTIFKITSSGVLKTIYTFCAQAGCPDGEYPTGPLIQANGYLYGATLAGGYSNCSQGCGTIFKITPTGELSTLYAFSSLDGETPNGLVEGDDGNLYGTTEQGGNVSDPCIEFYSGCGTVFKLSPSGQLTTLYNFCPDSFDCPDGYAPNGPLLQTSNGQFYGTTYGDSTVFSISATGTFETVHRFGGINQVTGPLVQATDGNLYGTTIQGAIRYGTIFQMNTVGASVVNTLHNFEGTDGAFPSVGPFQATSGMFYGTTDQGGTDNNCFEGCGTLYSMNVNLGPFIAFVHESGKVGQTGGILGQGFTGTTSVSLNGTPASFTVVSDTFIKATVPPGATTGLVTVVTPSGTLTSNVPFRVLQ